MGCVGYPTGNLSVVKEATSKRQQPFCLPGCRAVQENVPSLCRTLSSALSNIVQKLCDLSYAAGASLHPPPCGTHCCLRDDTNLSDEYSFSMKFSKV